MAKLPNPAISIRGRLQSKTGLFVLLSGLVAILVTGLAAATWPRPVRSATAPYVDITPPGPAVGGTLVEVTVTFCPTDSPLDDETWSVQVTNASIIKPFVYTSNAVLAAAEKTAAAPPGDCTVSATAKGRIALTPGVTASVQASIRNLLGQLGMAAKTYVYDTPPVISFNPPSGTFASAALPVTITWSDDIGLNAGMRDIKLNGVTVTNQFNYVTAGASATSSGTITLQEGANTLTASICDTSVQCVQSSVTYTHVRPLLDVSMNPGPLVERSACVTAGAGPGAFQCGELLLAHSMPAYRSRERDRSLTLLYNSSTAKPHPVVMADIRLRPGTGQPDQLHARLVVNGVSGPTYTYKNTGLADDGAPRRIAIGYDASTLTTGIYPYTLEITRVYGTLQVSDTASGELVVVNRAASPYGAGWSVAGVEQIVPYQRNNALLLVRADGSTAIYESIGSNMWLAPAGEYRDTIRWGSVQNPIGQTDSYYYRTLLNRSRIFYNIHGLQKWVSYPDNSKVEYKYRNESDVNARLDTIRVSPYESALKYAFETISDSVFRVRDPAGRVMTVYKNVADNTLRSIADPGLSARVQLTYNARRLATWRSRRGHVTTFDYWGNTSLLRSVALPPTHAGIATTTFTPTRRRGLALAPSGNTVDATPTTTIDGPRTDVTDVTSFHENNLGAPVRIVDAHGYSTHIAYDTDNPLLPVRVQSPDGRVQRFRYDASARLVWAEDSTHSAGRDSTTYTYGSANAPSLPTRAYSPRSPGVRDSIRYFYNAMGLPDSIIDARGHKSGYRYNARGQVEKVTEYKVAVVASPTAPPVADSIVTKFEYEPTSANLTATVTPLGYKTEVKRDPVGRVEKVLDATGDSVKYTYDDMNRIRSVVQVDSSSTAPYPLIAITTTMDYDDDGNRIQVTDHRGVIRRWEYDAIGRDTAVVDEFNRKEIRRYDLADNLVLLKNRQRDSIRTVYDALGRDTLRIIGAVTFDGDETSYYWTGGLVYGPELIPEDQVRTEYDPMGRITKTENLSGSRVTRIWNKEGTLKSETQTLKIPTPPPATTFSYTYNRASERVSMTSSLYNRTFTYSYDAGGALSSISIPGVGSVHLRHDALGRRDSVAYPNGTVAKYRFDADGRVRKIDVVKGGVTQLSLAYSNYDAVGRVLTLTRSGTRALPQPQLFSWTYGYRGFLRRTAVDGIGSSYRYDESGNLIWKDEAGVVSTYAIQAGSNRIQARTRGVREYTTRYDLNGNLTHEVRADDPSFRQYLYHDALNRLVKTVYPESEILYHYDGLGRTVRRPIPAWSRAWQMYDGSNVAIHNNVEFIHGSGVDDPLVALAPPGQGICGNWSAAYFVTLGNRLLDF